MRGKRAKELRRMASNEYLKVLMKQNEAGAPMPPARALVHAGIPGSVKHRQAINHPQTLRALYRLMKKAWKQFASNPTKPPRFA
jgi:hypothetical protein